MAAKWQTVRVFISSTFKDMQAERDHLVRFVFPRLRQELLKRHVHFRDVDLRWGVTSEQDALDVCREIIDECRPRFLCMLGGRYGWSPPGQDRSITADEIHYAAIDHPNPDRHHFFYFRDPAATRAMIEDVSGEYRELPGSQNEQKLEQLKQAVRDAGFDPFLYSADWDAEQKRLVGLKEFGKHVYRKLLDSIDDELGTQEVEALDEFAEENAAMETFIVERVERYIAGSRQTVIDDLSDFAKTEGVPNLLVLTGTPGSGKSALLGKFYQDFVEADEQALVIPHFVGASTGSTDLRRTLRRLCHELAGAIDDTDEIPTDIRELNEQFSSLLQEVAETRRIVLIIDALNQMNASDNAHTLNWLPQEFPDNVRMVVSSLEHPALEALRQRGKSVREVVLEPLNADDAKAIIRGVLNRYSKQLDRTQLNLLLTKPDAGTPLYLLVALEELRTLGDYDEITERIGALPGTTQKLFLWILKERLSKDPGFRNADGNLIGTDLVQKFVSPLGVSRHGLSESELAGLIAPGHSDADLQIPDDALGHVAALQRLLQPYLMQRGEFLDFYHGQFREAVETEYLDEKQERLSAHRRIAEYFYRQLNPAEGEPFSGDSPHALSELPYHQTNGECWDKLDAMLTNLRFVDAKCTAGMTFELVKDYLVALDALPELQEEQDEVHRRNERLRQYGADLIAYAKAKGEGVPLPKPPDTHESLESMRRAESVFPSPNTTPGDTSAARMRMLANFVSTNSHKLEHFPDQTLPIAANHSIAGPVVDQAEDLISTLRTPWLHRSPRPPTPPLTPLCLRTLEGHTESVYSVALTPDGKRAVSASGDKTLRVWDLDTGVCLRTLAGHTNEVLSVALTSDGKRAVSASSDKTLRVWDLDTGVCLRTLEGHNGWVTSVALTPDGKRAVSASDHSKDKTLRVWDVQTGACLRTLEGHTDSVNSVALTSDGKRAVSASGHTFSDENTLRVWDLDTGACLRTLEGHTDSVTSVALTPDGKLAVSAGKDNTLRVWGLGTSRISTGLWEMLRQLWSILKNRRINSAACLRTLKRRTRWVNSVALTPDGKRAVSANRDKTLRVWDVQTGACLRTLEGHTESVNSVALTPDGTRAVSASSDNTLRVWDLDTGVCLRTLEGHTSWVTSVALTPDGKHAVSAGDSTAGGGKTLRVWDVQTGAYLRTLEGHISWVNSVALTHDGKRAVSTSRDTTLRVWDLETGVCLRTLEGHTRDVTSVALTPDGKRAVSASDDRTLRVWDLDTSRISTGLWEMLRQLWSILKNRRINSGACLRTLEGHNAWVRSVALTPDGKRAVSASDDKTIRVWDLETGVCLRTLEGHTSWVLSVALTPDGKRAVSADKTLRVWDVQTGACLRTLEGHTSWVTSVALTPDGKRAVSASEDKPLRVWDLETGVCLRTLEGHTDSVTSVALTPDGKLAVSAGKDNTLRVWGLETGKMIAVYPLESAGFSVAIAAANQFIAGTQSGQLHFLTLKNWP